MSKDDLPLLLQMYLERMRDFVRKLKGGYSEEELSEERQVITELGKQLEDRNRYDEPSGR